MRVAAALLALHSVFGPKGHVRAAALAVGALAAAVAAAAARRPARATTRRERLAAAAALAATALLAAEVALGRASLRRCAGEEPPPLHVTLITSPRSADRAAAATAWMRAAGLEPETWQAPDVFDEAKRRAASPAASGAQLSTLRHRVYAETWRDLLRARGGLPAAGRLVVFEDDAAPGWAFTRRLRAAACGPADVVVLDSRASLEWALRGRVGPAGTTGVMLSARGAEVLAAAVDADNSMRTIDVLMREACNTGAATCDLVPLVFESGVPSALLPRCSKVECGPEDE